MQPTIYYKLDPLGVYSEKGQKYSCKPVCNELDKVAAQKLGWKPTLAELFNKKKRGRPARVVDEKTTD